MLNSLLVLIGAHYIADYPLQGEFLAQTKGKYWYSLLAHSVIYTFVIGICLYILGSYSIWKALFILSSHMIIDCKKAKARDKQKALTTYLYIDQGLHVGINILLYLI
jgi:hypothetical protein